MDNNIYDLARALRKNMTKEERRLWYEFLRDYHVRFMRQRPIDRYIVDFYCAKAMLVIELDGSQHYDEKGVTKDSERDADLAGEGIKVIHIPNSEVNLNYAGVCEFIDIEVKKRLKL